jgi:glycogen debranching enzyme
MHTLAAPSSRAYLLALALLFAAFFAIPAAIHAQSIPAFGPLDPIAFDTSGPALTASTETEKPFTVAGQRGVLLGQQNGVFESWILPVKLLSHLTIEANIEGYGVPIDLNQYSAAIEVRPDRTIITYSHPGFTVRQIMFSPGSAPSAVGPAQTGPIVLFEFDCLHPTDFTLRFTPELKWMWPERNEGTPSAEWVVPHQATESNSASSLGNSSGAPNDRSSSLGNSYYVLHTDYPDLAGAITIPGAQPGILAPYQERPQFHPVELRLHIDPIRDRGRLFPLLMAAGINPASATNAALGATLAQLNAAIPALYQAHAAAYKRLLANSVSIETPDKSLDEAFQWAVLSIEQLKTLVQKENGVEDPETALVAGYYTSADSTRPGFGWFFGRDDLYTLYAVNGYGDFALSKSELEFLIHRQRADGKIMHEYSQTAAAVDWQSFPYMYAAADSTPLFLLAVADYVRSSGDTAFLTAHRDAIEKAWAFETDPAHDTDHDGIYDNSQGTGWVESWPGGMPHQEIYLALLDQQASSAMASIESLLGDEKESSTARARADQIARTINTEYYDPQKSCYAFSRNADGSQDRTTTVYPALAWWDPVPGQPILQKGEECLRHFAASALNTDWGLRDVSNEEKIYDGMSYHQGSVWPLFTGWAALAEYRGNQPLAGYQLLKENANLTRAQDLGAVTELLSGDFFVPFGRSTSHQLWSSAMVITPTLRGLFGIRIDAQSKTITVNPHLPADWKDAAIRHLQLPNGSTDLVFTRDGANLKVSITADNAAEGWGLRSDVSGTRIDKGEQIGLVLPLSTVELGEPSHGAPIPGARPRAFRVLSERWKPNSVSLMVEGLAGSSAVIPVYRHKLVKLGLQVSGGLSNQADSDHPGVVLAAIDTAWQDASLPLGFWFYFPPGTGFQTITVTLTW